MFGNRLGWGISALLAGLLVLVTWYIGSLNVVSPPSVGIVAKTGNVSLNLAAHPDILDPIQLPFDPQAIMPAMTDAKDPASTYREAIEKYKAAKSEGNFIYRDLFQSKPKTTDLKDLPIFQMLIDVRNCKPANIFGSNPSDVIDYDPAASERLESIYTLGKTASHLALYLQKDNPQEAMLLAEAAFSLGAKMCQERLRWREFEGGADIVREAAFVIKSLSDGARAQAADIDPPMRTLLKERGIPLWTAIGSADGNIIARTAGDVFFIAKNSREQMWRTEAILKLGRNKFFMGESARGADQRWAKIILKRMDNDSKLDPLTHTAAKAGSELTLEGFRKISS